MPRKNEPDLDVLTVAMRELLAEAEREAIELDPVLRITAEAVCDVADALAGRLFYGFTASGSLRLWRRDKLERRKKPGATLCGAMTRKGTPCKALPMPGKARCKFHGGASTGPRTSEGRARIAESNRRRALARSSLPGG